MDLVSLTAEILKNDGKGDVYRLLVQTDQVTGKTGLELLAEGTKDADLPFSGGYILHFMHFHHPWSHRGYLSKSSSADETVKYTTWRKINGKTVTGMRPFTNWAAPCTWCRT